MFRLTKDEYYLILRLQNVTLELEQGKYSKYLPYAFTEQGIYMLMTVLKGDLAIEQSKSLIRIFKNMKDYLINNNLLDQKYINNMVLNHNNDFHDRFIVLDKNKIYHLGSTINHIGNKTFVINIIGEPLVKKSLLNEINKICKVTVN